MGLRGGPPHVLTAHWSISESLKLFADAVVPDPIEKAHVLSPALPAMAMFDKAEQ